MPTISVIIPVYNGQDTIRETIKSVLNQSHTDLEVLVINDGSLDATLKIISRIEDARLQVFSYPNKGLSASRNRGIAKAKGEYISFIDADDLWTIDKLELQLKALQENPEAALAYSWTDYIDESSQFLFSGRHITLNGDVYKELLVNNFLENGSNALIRSKVLSEVGNFDESLSASEDWDMWLRIAPRYHFVSVPSPQILYRVSTISMSANLGRQEAEMFKVIERAFERAPNSLQYLKKHSLANLYKYLVWKSLEHASLAGNSWTPLRLTWNYIKHEPALFKEAKFASIMAIKSAIAALLPPQQAKRLLTRLKKNSN